MNVDVVFRRLIEFERAIAQLYERWAEVFSEDREAALLWSKMAIEEIGHANLILYQRRVFKNDPNLSADVDVALDEVVMLLGIVRRSMEGPPHGPEEAVRLAAWIEASAAESELRGALRESNPDIQRLLDHLGGDDRQHVERLKAFAQKRGISLPATHAP